MTGYDLADEIFKNIGKTENHEISLEDMIRVLSFWGFNEEAPRNDKIGFVCYCARERLKKTIEKALVWGDYTLLNEFISKLSADMRGDKE